MTSATSAPLATSRRRSGFTPGFTLVELLVVIGIIVLLMGLLLPMLSRAMRQSKRIRTASDLNAIGAALDAYKHDFGDYPRITYTATSIYNGTGSGASLLGKALLALGDGATAIASASSYTPGQIVTITAGALPEYQSLQSQSGTSPALNSPAWAPIPMFAADGADGPGFRLRGTQGQIHQPYLQPDKFPTLGLAILDSFGDPILYFPANPSRPSTGQNTTAGVFGSTSTYGGQSNNYIGVAPGDTPGSSPVTPTSPCPSFYNYSDNDTSALNAATSPGAFPAAFPDIISMEAMLGDFNHNGYIEPGESAATTANYLLWSAGPDGQYGPVSGEPNALSSFQNLDATSVKNRVIKCDDVTNFSFGQ